MNVGILRLYHQQVAHTRLEMPEQVVAWLGGMQAQDYPGAKWSIGLRLPQATDAAVERAISERRIIRTWAMRGTLHFVAAADVRWMLALTSPKNLAGAARRRQQLELDDATLARCRKLFTKALQGGKQLGRDELYALLERANISTAAQRGYHILWNSALQGVICFAATSGKEQTFALLEERVAPTREKTRDEALAELALRYFTSRGPATLQDFTWWSGLSAGEACAGLEAVRSQLLQQTVNKQAFWMAPDIAVPKETAGAFALPGFDEFLLGYKDRSAVLDARHAQQVCPGGNGMFAPTIVINGRVAGTWKRTIRKTAVEIGATPFVPLRKAERTAFAAAAESYAAFMGLPAVFV